MPAFIVLHIPHSRTGTETHGEVGGLIASRLDVPHLQLDGVWLVYSEEMADGILDRLSDGLPLEDALVVFEIGEQAAWRGLTDEQGEWLVSQVW
jgi:hypothetical protein